MAQETRITNPYTNNAIQKKVTMPPNTNTKGAQARRHLSDELKNSMILVSTARHSCAPHHAF
jgi:hypothetical protein